MCFYALKSPLCDRRESGVQRVREEGRQVPEVEAAHRERDPGELAVDREPPRQASPTAGGA